MYNLTEYNHNYTKTSGIYGNTSKITVMITCHLNDSESFILKLRFTNNTGGAGTANVETAVPLNFLSNIWRIPKMLLIN